MNRAASRASCNGYGQNGMAMSFVTVVYSRDYPLLELQALSMARFLDTGQVGSIQVVMNDCNEAVLERALEPLLAAYGPLAAKLRILRGDDLLREGWRGNDGYRMQQALNLAAAARAPCERVVILDTQNLFLRPVTAEDFFTSDVRGKLTFLRPENECHRAWWRESLNALGMRVHSLCEFEGA